MTEPEWYCEGCNSRETGEPAYKETVPGHEGHIGLWFCQECTE